MFVLEDYDDDNDNVLKVNITSTITNGRTYISNKTKPVK
jgi:hypothetical protein